jgi:hypothetical protein
MCSACAKPVPLKAPEPPSRVRPGWAEQLTPHVDAIAACLDLREPPRYVVFLDPLPSGASGVTTVDAFGAIEHCAYLDGRIARRQPADFAITEVGAVGGALFSLGPTRPILPADEALEEVVDHGRLLGWLFWPTGDERADQAAGGEVVP